MSEFIAALPMYDWPELQAGTDAQWAAIRDRLRQEGLDAPACLTRRNADMPPAPGGIRDATGHVIAPDPATLPPDEFDLFTLWRHPKLLLAQTCWGPMQTTGLAPHVQMVAQPDYSDCEGGKGAFYSSAIIMRGTGDTPAPADGRPLLALDLLRGRRLAYNSPDSMSGILALTQELEKIGGGIGLFAACIETGGHRASALAVAKGEADVAAIDCRTWNLFKRLEPDAAALLQVIGWTARRRGLPLITARSTPAGVLAILRQAVADASFAAL